MVQTWWVHTCRKTLKLQCNRWNWSHFNEVFPGPCWPRWMVMTPVKLKATVQSTPRIRSWNQALRRPPAVLRRLRRPTKAAKPTQCSPPRSLYCVEDPPSWFYSSSSSRASPSTSHFLHWSPVAGWTAPCSGWTSPRRQFSLHWTSSPRLYRFSSDLQLQPSGGCIHVPLGNRWKIK